MANKTIRDIFNDATTLEINSMIVDGITGRKMPGTTIAFFEIISAWAKQFSILNKKINYNPSPPPKIITAVNEWSKQQDNLLRKYGIEYTKKENIPTLKNLMEDPHVTDILKTEDFIVFQQLIQTNIKGKANQDEIMAEISRLRTTQSRLLWLITRFNNWYEHKPSPEGLEQMADRDDHELRKLWELKDGYIFAQNIIQLDGDIITRYNKRLYRDREIREKSDQLLRFHKGNVEAGLKHWHFIVETISSIAKALTGLFSKT